MDVKAKRISIGKAKKRIKNDPELNSGSFFVNEEKTDKSEFEGFKQISP